MICNYEKILYILSIFILCVSIQHVVHSQTDAPKLTSDCLEESKIRDQKYVENIMKDIKSVFHLNFDEGGFGKLIKEI